MRNRIKFASFVGDLACYWLNFNLTLMAGIITQQCHPTIDALSSVEGNVCVLYMVLHSSMEVALHLILVHRWLDICPSQMIVDWILYSAKAKPSVEDCPAIFLVSLSETRVLMKLSQYFIECWHLNLVWHVFQVIVDLVLIVPLENGQPLCFSLFQKV
jgi:hypothetical protein